MPARPARIVPLSAWFGLPIAARQKAALEAAISTWLNPAYRAVKKASPVVQVGKKVLARLPLKSAQTTCSLHPFSSVGDSVRFMGASGINIGVCGCFLDHLAECF